MMRMMTRWSFAQADLRRAIALVFVIGLLQLSCSSGSKPGLPGFDESASEEAFVLTAPDAVSIYGMIFRPRSDGPVPLILAFHQGGASGLAEYKPIIPRLLREGFAVLTIDQRRGGDLFGGVNRTAGEFGNPDFPYCNVYTDLETTLDHALRLPGITDVIVWGSSYSATLAAQLAADYPGAVSHVVAFSPASGDVMGRCQAVPIAQRIQIPALFVRPPNELEIDWVASDFQAFRAMGHRTIIAEPGAHGASSLVPERAGGDTDLLWQSVLSFMGNEEPASD